MSDEPTKLYLEVRGADGRWTTTASFNEEDPQALRALVKARDTDPTARVRLTNDRAQVVLDIQPAVLDAPGE
jgi:hypothetical protein